MRKLFKKRSAKASSASVTTMKSKRSFKQVIKSRTEHWNFKKISVSLVSLAVLVGLATAWVWYSRMYMTPERRFYSALENSMATDSVVRTLTQGGSGNQVVQSYRFHFAPQRVIENTVNYTERSATVNTSVKTEGIIYPNEQFLRYTAYESSGQNAVNLNLEEVLNEWANETPADDEQSGLNYLSEQVSLAIFGNFSPEFRNQTLKTIKDQQIYMTEFDKAIDDTVDGEEVVRYTVSVQLKEYAILLNQSFKQAGYGEFPPLNPDNYREDATVNAQFTVRKRDNTLVGVNFGGRDEQYGNYGVQKNIDRPTAVRTVEELQSEVQALFQDQQAQ